MSSSTSGRVARAMIRGLKGRCPHCGQGALFYRYLKVSPHCDACGEDLDQYPSDDGPAYFTILLVGHLIVAPLLLFPLIWTAPVAVIVPATLIPLGGLTLVVLPRVKGAVIRPALRAQGQTRRRRPPHGGSISLEHADIGRNRLTSGSCSRINSLEPDSPVKSVSAQRDQALGSPSRPLPAGLRRRHGGYAAGGG